MKSKRKSIMPPAQKNGTLMASNNPIAIMFKLNLWLKSLKTRITLIWRVMKKIKFNRSALNLEAPDKRKNNAATKGIKIPVD